MYSVRLMKYASENDWPALSPVACPCVIFCVLKRTCSCAWATSRGSTPERVSRAFSTSRPSVSRSIPMSSSEEIFEALYSAAPVSSTESVSTR